MKLFFTRREWCSLPHELRLKIAESFGLSKSEGTVSEQSGGIMRMESDGHSQNDLMKLSIGSMLQFLGETDENYFNELFKQVVKKLDPEVVLTAPEEKKEEIRLPISTSILNSAAHVKNDGGDSESPKRRGMPKGGWPKPAVTI